MQGSICQVFELIAVHIHYFCSGFHVVYLYAQKPVADCRIQSGFCIVKTSDRAAFFISISVLVCRLSIYGAVLSNLQLFILGDIRPASVLPDLCLQLHQLKVSGFGGIRNFECYSSDIVIPAVRLVDIDGNVRFLVAAGFIICRAYGAVVVIFIRPALCPTGAHCRLDVISRYALPHFFRMDVFTVCKQAKRQAQQERRRGKRECLK